MDKNKKHDFVIGLICLFSMTLIIFFITKTLSSIELNKYHASANYKLIYLFSQINQIVSFITPITLFSFYLLTTKLMLFLLDYSINVSSIVRIVGLSFIPVIIASLFFLISIVSVIQNKGIDISMITDEPLFFNLLTINDYQYISFISWFAFYFIFIVLLQRINKISPLNAAAIALTPSLIVICVRYVISFF